MSTLSSSMQIAVTALNAQSAAVSTISNNLANSDTIGYKSTDASFYSLVTGSGSANSFTGAGVVASPSQKISQQGLIVGTQTATDLAVDGDGFFVVTGAADSDVFAYTRTGDFYTDANGYLVNSNGYYLQGYPTDRDGKITTSNSAAGLEPINLYNANGSAVATSELMLQANIPADAAVGDRGRDLRQPRRRPFRDAELHQDRGKRMVDERLGPRAVVRRDDRFGDGCRRRRHNVQCRRHARINRPRPLRHHGNGLVDRRGRQHHRL